MTERGERERLAMTFDAAADIYDEARPGYPPALFDDLARLCNLREGSRVLEIGCGTGKATLPLAQRGYRVRCLERGPRLASVARRNLAHFPNVAIDVTTFEAVPLAPDSYDLVVAATCWDWLDPAVKYQKAAQVLRADGSAAVFSNMHVYIEGEDAFWPAVQAAYRRHTPGMEGLPPTPDSLPAEVDPGLIETGAFEQVAVLRYPWTETYDTQRYLRVLRTFSGHIALPESTREALLRDIASIIDRDFGGSIVKHWVTLLQIARKRQHS